MPSLTDTLCTRCGLCCDGSLFAEVELTGRAESTELEILGLEIEDDDSNGAQLLQPCAALQGRRCSIYAHRPQCCRTFECRLLQDVRCGAVSMKLALERIVEAQNGIRRAEELLMQLGQRATRLPLRERCAEALILETGGNPEMNRKRAELEAVMVGVEKLMRKTFLGPGGGHGVTDQG